MREESKSETRERIKRSIEQTAEIVRFLLEINNRPKILEEMPEKELNAIFQKYCENSRDIYRLTRSPRQIYLAIQEEKMKTPQQRKLEEQQRQEAERHFEERKRRGELW